MILDSKCMVCGNAHKRRSFLLDSGVCPICQTNISPAEIKTILTQGHIVRGFITCMILVLAAFILPLAYEMFAVKGGSDAASKGMTTGFLFFIPVFIMSFIAISMFFRTLLAFPRIETKHRVLGLIPSVLLLLLVLIISLH